MNPSAKGPDWNNQDPKLQNFERAYSAGTAGCRRRCNCDLIYFHDDPRFYTWEEGELESLRNDEMAHGLEYTPGDLRIEGKDYVDACSCWHERALKIIAYIEENAGPIAAFLSLEKARKLAEANASPVVT